MKRARGNLKDLARSLWAFHLNSGSCNACDIEVLAAMMPRYDAGRFGIKLVGTPRHADVLVITGTMTGKIREKALRVYRQMPEPKVVIVVGNCGATGGVYGRTYATGGSVDIYIPVDVYVPGCPVRPEAVIHGISLAWKKLEGTEDGHDVPA